VKQLTAMSFEPLLCMLDYHLIITGFGHLIKNSKLV